jgi:zinc transport system substrate-binding protein
MLFSLLKTYKLPSDETGKLSAVATTFPIYDILRTVGGDQVDSSLLLAPGASPHSFELSPQKAKSLSDANLFIYNGLGLDSWASSMSLANTSKGAEVRRELDLSSHVNLLRFSDKEAVEVSEDDSQSHQEAHGREEDIDPHYWLDPINASLMAEAIAQELGELDPVNKDYYLNNASLFGRDLATKLTTWQSQINQLPSNKIIVFHDAWFYFANRFGIEIVGALEPFPGKSPSPKYLDQVSNLIKDNNISVLFIEPQLAPDLARALAQNLVSDIAILDPLGGVEGRESYIELIDYSINTLVSSLK